MPSYYVYEDHPIGPEVQQPLHEWNSWRGSESSFLDSHIYVWHCIHLAIHTRNEWMNEGMNVSVALLVEEVHVILLQTCEPFVILQYFLCQIFKKASLWWFTGDPKVILHYKFPVCIFIINIFSFTQPMIMSLLHWIVSATHWWVNICRQSTGLSYWQ